MAEKREKLSKEERISVASVVIKIAFLAIAIGLALTLASLLVPITVPSVADIDDMRFGKPFPYMIQSFSGVPNEEFFPCKCIPKFTERYSTEISIGMFCASWGVNSLIGAAIVLGVRYLKKRKQAKATVNAPEIEIKDGFAVTEDEKKQV